ncbi:MAG: glycosyltransferase [Gammaproteobacteria bacterium]|nr:MAG: glycosyltransferase [Gammaproteobacteria bacterium]
MKVTTSCSGRFHIFDQARQLHCHGVLHRFINDYPKWMTRRWGVPDEKVESLVANGVLGRMTRWIPDSWSPIFKSRVVERVHDLFSRRLAGYVPPDSDVFIGLSSFCLQAIERAKELGQITIVDHGSLHQRTERRLLEEECQLHGLPLEVESAPQWLIDKEDEEFSAADRVMVLSEAARRSFIEEGIDGAKIFVNPCGVDLSQFSPLNSEQNGCFRIIYCGNISLRKGIHYLLQAFSELKLDNAELWLIGSMPSPSFGRLIEKYKSEKVRFLGTFQQGELRQIYTRGSVLVLPSLADGFGLVVPQAMACGLPVIVSRNVGAADIVTEGVDGYVVPIRNVEALKNRLFFLYTNSTQRMAMADAACAKAQKALGWDQYGDCLVHFLRTLRPE